MTQSPAELLREQGHPIGEIFLTRAEIAARVVGARSDARGRVRRPGAAARRSAQVEHRLPRRSLAGDVDHAWVRHGRARCVRRGRRWRAAARRISTTRSQVAHVIVIEDVVDTGLTLSFLMRTFDEREPASLAAVSLLDRPYRRLVEDFPSRTSASPRRTSSSPATGSASTSTGARSPTCTWSWRPSLPA